MLPAEVRDLLSGEPGDDVWEPVAHLLTTGNDGFPRVCLLSRAELAARQDGIGCVVRATHTIANLRRDGKALLVVTGERAAHYVRLRVRTILGADRGPAGGNDGDGGNGGDRERVAVAFDVAGAETDTLGIPLRPMMFHSSSRVRHLEHWDDNRAFLERLGFG